MKSKQLSQSTISTFKTHKEAIDAFYALIENWDDPPNPQNDNALRRLPGFLAQLKTWVDQSDKLGTWSRKHFETLCNARCDGRIGFLLRASAFSEYDFLVNKLLDRGWDPAMYIQDQGVSSLGYAAYALKPVAVAKFLKHCPPPDCRLALKAEHLTGYDKHRLTGSTLLHRLGERQSGGFALSDSNTLKQVIDLLIDHDPEALLAKTKGGQFPENFAGGALKTYLAERRAAYQASQSQVDLQDATQEALATAPSTGPRKL